MSESNNTEIELSLWAPWRSQHPSGNAKCYRGFFDCICFDHPLAPVSRQNVAFVAPFVQPPSSLQQLQVSFLGEMQVPQHKVAYVSTAHQQYVCLVSKMLSHIALPNIDIFCIVLWRQQPVSAQVWSSSHNSRRLVIIRMIVDELQFLPLGSCVRGTTTVSPHSLNQ